MSDRKVVEALRDEYLATADGYGSWEQQKAKKWRVKAAALTALLDDARRYAWLRECQSIPADILCHHHDALDAAIDEALEDLEDFGAITVEIERGYVKWTDATGNLRLRSEGKTMSAALQRVEDYRRQVLEELLAECTEAQRVRFHTYIYPHGVSDDKVNDAILLCERTLAKSDAAQGAVQEPRG